MSRFPVTSGGNGSAITAVNVAACQDALGLSDHIVSGGAITDGGGLTIDYTECTYFHSGYQSIRAAGSGVSVTAASTNRVWLSNDGSIEIRTDASAPTPAGLLLGVVTTDGSSVTDIKHQMDPTPAFNVTNARHILRVKTADQSTGDQDSELQFEAAVREVWYVRCILIVVGGGDFRAQVAVPSGGTIWGMMAGDTDNYTTASVCTGAGKAPAYDHDSYPAQTGTLVTASSSSGVPLIFHALVHIGETAGTVQLVWDETTGTATMKAGSVLFAKRILG